MYGRNIASPSLQSGIETSPTSAPSPRSASAAALEVREHGLVADVRVGALARARRCAGRRRPRRAPPCSAPRSGSARTHCGVAPVAAGDHLEQQRRALDRAGDRGDEVDRVVDVRDAPGRHEPVRRPSPRRRRRTRRGCGRCRPGRRRARGRPRPRAPPSPSRPTSLRPSGSDRRGCAPARTRSSRRARTRRSRPCSASRRSSRRRRGSARRRPRRARACRRSRASRSSSARPRARCCP